MNNGEPMKYCLQRGYWNVWITSSEETKYNRRVHRLAWECYHDRTLMKGEIIDHDNRDRLDNSFNNLHLVDATWNSRKRSMQKNNTSGITGVSRCKDKKSNLSPKSMTIH